MPTPTRTVTAIHKDHGVIAALCNDDENWWTPADLAIDDIEEHRFCYVVGRGRARRPVHVVHRHSPFRWYLRSSADRFERNNLGALPETELELDIVTIPH